MFKEASQSAYQVYKDMVGEKGSDLDKLMEEVKRSKPNKPSSIKEEKYYKPFPEAKILQSI